MSESPDVTVGDIIRIRGTLTGIIAIVSRLYSAGKVEAVYFQSATKAIAEDFVWDGRDWVFRYNGATGKYADNLYPQLVAKLRREVSGL